MSNRPNNPDDDDFRDFLGDDDDIGGQDDDLTFDEFDRESTDLDDIDFGDEDSGPDDFDSGTGVTPGGGGPSRTFILIAGILIIVLLLGFGLLAYAILGPGTGPSSTDQTISAIETSNADVALLLTQTSDAGTQQAIGTGTAQAQLNFATETAASINATGTIEAQNAFATQTVAAQNAFATQTADAAGASGTGTALAQQAAQTQTSAALTLTAGGSIPASLTPGGGVDPAAIQQTATALRAALLTQTALAGQGPTQPPFGGPNTPTRTPSSLEDAGFIDDLGAGGPGALLMMGLALLGVIFLSRGLRAVNSNR